MRKLIVLIALLMCSEVRAQEVVDSASIYEKMRWLKLRGYNSVMVYILSLPTLESNITQEAKQYQHELELARWLDSTGYLRTYQYFKHLSDSLWNSYFAPEKLRRVRRYINQQQRIETLVNLIVDHFARHSFDGIDWDFEYPTIKKYEPEHIYTGGRAPCFPEKESSL